MSDKITNEQVSAILQDDEAGDEFRALVARFDPKCWARYDLSAMHIGWHFARQEGKQLTAERDAALARLREAHTELEAINRHIPDEYKLRTEGHMESAVREMAKDLREFEQQEPVGHQYQDSTGAWCDFLSQRHYENTVADGGFPIRAIYTRPIPAPVSVPQWQPIETAPSDVPVLLGWMDEWPRPEWRVEARVYHCTRAGSRHGMATHWMPLPAAPTKEKP